ncbi:MAG TPA: serine hydrolase, partial [Pyrinomonadaceae bacterium]|nr:serine hydrolase [Pyrinomonadaceae bacterium]
MIRKNLRVLASFLLLLSITAAALPIHAQKVGWASGQVAADYSKGLQAIEEKTEARRKELGIPGMSLVIVKDDKIIFIKGLGYKDFEHNQAVTPETQFA